MITRRLIREAAMLDEGFCLLCREQQPLLVPHPEGKGLCESCGALSVMPAADMLQIILLVDEEEEG